MNPRYRVAQYGVENHAENHQGEWFNGMRALEQATRHAQWCAEDGNVYVVHDLEQKNVVYVTKPNTLGAPNKKEKTNAKEKPTRYVHD